MRACSTVLLRTVGVLLVLLGVVAMHQLAGGHSTTTSLSAGTHAPRAVATAAPMPAAAPGTEGHTAGAASTSPALLTLDERPEWAGSTVSVVSTSAPLTGAAEIDGAQNWHDGMPTCVAVLTGLLVVLLPLLTQMRQAPVRLLAERRVRTSPAGRGPPRDLLAQLCVLRT